MNTGTCVWTICPGWLLGSTTTGIEPVTSRYLVRHATATPLSHTTCNSNICQQNIQQQVKLPVFRCNSMYVKAYCWHIIELRLTAGSRPWNGDQHWPYIHRTVAEHWWLRETLPLLMLYYYMPMLDLCRLIVLEVCWKSTVTTTDLASSYSCPVLNFWSVVFGYCW